MLLLVLVFLLAVGFGLLLTRLGRTIGERGGLLDRPDGRLKRHPRPVAAVGGVALWATLPATLLVTGLLFEGVADSFAAQRIRWLFVALAVAAKAVIGLFDDLWSLRPGHKLFGQALSVAVLMLGGDVLIRDATAFGWTVSLGVFSAPLTLLWCLFVINALNLLDGMDGMLATVGGVALLGLAVVGHGAAALVAAAALGGLVGFLRYNLPPATVYLGDCGSMALGLLVATLTLDTFRTGGAFAPVPALTLLVLPFLDTTAAVVRRSLTGVPVASGDRQHLHHTLLQQGFGIPVSLAVVAAVGSVTALAAGLGFTFGSDLLSLGGATAVAAVLLGFGLFGRTEARLIRSASGLLLSAVGRRCLPSVRPVAARTQEQPRAK